MLKILLQSIPGILFEPIAVGAVLGLITAAIFLWKKRPVLYWVVAFSLLFMLGWRLAIQIISGRYASILIFPAIIATAYFIFKMEMLTAYIPKFPEWLRKWLPYLTVIGIAIGGVGQLCHYNAYADRILKIAELIKSDAKQYKSSCILTSEDRRLRYYTGLPANSIYMTNVSPNSLQKEIAAVLKKGPDQPAEICYIVLPMSSKLPVDHYFQQVPEHIRKELVLLGEFYHNRKKRRMTRVYRYDIKKAYNITVVSSGSVQVAGKKICTCTFEKTYPADSKFYIYTDKYFKNPQWNLQAPVLTAFPIEWQPAGTGGYARGSNGELGGRILPDGQNVLRLKSDALIALFRPRALRIAKYRVKMTVSGTPGSVFAFGAHYYANKHCGFWTLPRQQIPGPGTWDFVLTQKYVPNFAKEMKSVLQLYHGEIFVHSIELYEVEDDK